MGKIQRGEIVKDIEIVDIGADGKAVGKKDNMVIFISNAVPGDIVDARITKTRRSFHQGVPVSFTRHSSYKTEARCKHFGVCGGCKWQNLTYDRQLYYKNRQVLENLSRIGKVPVKCIEEIVPAPDTFYYRNKLEFTFTNKRWLTEDEISQERKKNMNGLGFHVPGLFSKVVDLEECFLQRQPSDKIRLAVKAYALEKGLSFFNIIKKEGLLRNLIIRTANSGDLMVILVFSHDSEEERLGLLAHIWSLFPEITSLMYVINPKKNDSINDLDVVLYKGQSYITEKMDTLEFRIGPKSFFQTNSAQAYCLYKIVKDFASLTGDEVVYDLYTGTGTIAQFIARQAKKVVGVEYIEEAVENARDNCTHNAIQNTVFVAGVMEKIFDNDFVSLHGAPHVVITDPPRSGMHPRVIEQLRKLHPARIVYVSCNPSTQARDIALLSDCYDVSKVRAVDMFPHTSHVESVALLERKHL